jgi:hypothetical protein
MIHRFALPVAVAALLSAGAFVALAAEPVKLSGREAFKAYCRPCHLADSKAGEYTPLTLIQDQWSRFFEKKYAKAHEGVVDPNHDGKKVLDVITPELLDSIRTFAIDHAADSEHPMTCG